MDQTLFNLNDFLKVTDMHEARQCGKKRKWQKWERSNESQEEIKRSKWKWRRERQGMTYTLSQLWMRKNSNRGDAQQDQSTSSQAPLCFLLSGWVPARLCHYVGVYRGVFFCWQSCPETEALCISAPLPPPFSLLPPLQLFSSTHSDFLSFSVLFSSICLCALLALEFMRL